MYLDKHGKFSILGNYSPGNFMILLQCAVSFLLNRKAWRNKYFYDGEQYIEVVTCLSYVFILTLFWIKVQCTSLSSRGTVWNKLLIVKVYISGVMALCYSLSRMKYRTFILPLFSNLLRKSIFNRVIRYSSDSSKIRVHGSRTEDASAKVGWFAKSFTPEDLSTGNVFLSGTHDKKNSEMMILTTRLFS